MIAVIRDPPNDEADLIINELKKKTEVEIIYRDELTYPMEIKSNTILRWDSVEKRPISQILKYLEIFEREKKIINSVEMMRIGENKGLMGWLFKKNNLLTPEFAVVDNVETALKLAEKLGYPVVVKPVAGTGGKNVMKFDNEEELKNKMENLINKKDNVWIVQEYIEKPGRDIRIVVVGGEISIAYYRIGKSWVTNVHQGATRRKFDGDKEVLETAIKAAETVGEGIIGVDIAEGKEGYYILELNMKPGIPMFSTDFARKMSKDIADYVLANLE